MPLYNKILLIFLITFLRVTTGKECTNTTFITSPCYNEYQWLITIPKTNASCIGKTLSEPKTVPCNFACEKGKAFSTDKLACKSCAEGTYSLGSGYQYTFDESKSLDNLAPDILVDATEFMSGYDKLCKVNDLWKIKGNTLQGNVIHNCALTLTLRFKIRQTGLIKIEYNFASSYVFGTIASRCDFSIKNEDGKYSKSGAKTRIDVTLPPTGYGAWNSAKYPINEGGEYVLELYTLGLNAFHFPLSIRSIVVEGTSHIQQCLPCPPGTYASNRNSESCKPCPKNTYAESEGSTECIKCDSDRFSDDGASRCTERPKCELKHYKKVFVGCDKSNLAKIQYEPIQPKICTGDYKLPEPKTSTCRTCNPGMYKNPTSGKCEFCPSKTYSNGTLNDCLPCLNDLSLVPGLYYKNWNELPIYFNRTYISLDESDNLNYLFHNQSWIPSIDYISAQALPDIFSTLSLTIIKGFQVTDIAKTTKQYGTLYFNFSTQCQSKCKLFLVSQDLSDNDDNDWEIIHKWSITNKADHNEIIEYTYLISYPDGIMLNWLFTSDGIGEDIDEVRIYEIRVTNTKIGGSDRCISCLTINNKETECKSCIPGYILSNNTCVSCPKSTIASRKEPTDLTPTICNPCIENTISDDGVSCYVPCQQKFNGTIEYNLNEISTIEFHGSKLFTTQGSGYYHVFNASICGKTSVTCAKTSTSNDDRGLRTQMKIESKLCRMGSVPDKTDNITSVAYIDDFGEQLVNLSFTTSKHFPALRSDYDLADITIVYRAKATIVKSTCSERITFLSLRCDHRLNEENNSSLLKYKLLTPSDCVTGTCDGCIFHFLLRTPYACPTCDEKTNGYRIFNGPCKLGRQEIRKIPYPYCSHQLGDKTEIHRCSIVSTEFQILIILFILIAGILIGIVILCWRKNQKLEYRYMQLIENTNPDDDTPADNVCAQLSDDEDSGEEIQFKKQTKTRRIMNVIRNAIGHNSNNGQFDSINRDSFLLTNASTNEA